MRLDDLDENVVGRVTDISSDDPELESKLREIGFAENDEVEVVHHGPVARKPLCVRLNQTLIALRTEEAAAITVEKAS